MCGNSGGDPTRNCREKDMSSLQDRQKKEEERRRKLEESGNRWGRAGMFTSIPFIFLVYVGVGFFAGRWVDNRFSTNGVFMAIFMMVGVAGAFREIFSMLKKL